MLGGIYVLETFIDKSSIKGMGFWDNKIYYGNIKKSLVGNN